MTAAGFRRVHRSPAALPGFLFLFLLLAVVCPAMTGQERASSGAPPAGGTERKPVAHEPPSQESQASIARGRPAKESRPAAGEEEGAEFKQSASVRLVARLTGLSLHAAYWLCVGLNFAVVAGAMLWVFRSKLPGVFRSRTGLIRKAMDEARKASEDANRRLGEIEARLGRLDTEISGMRQAAETEAAAEEQRIRAASEEDKRKIVEAAEQEIATAARLARRDLTAYAADLAVSLAQKKIQVDLASDQALVRGFANGLSDEPERTGKDGR